MSNGNHFGDELEVFNHRMYSVALMVDGMSRYLLDFPEFIRLDWIDQFSLTRDALQASGIAGSHDLRDVTRTDENLPVLNKANPAVNVDVDASSGSNVTPDTRMPVGDLSAKVRLRVRFAVEDAIVGIGAVLKQHPQPVKRLPN
jgi:hypothetical protein